MFYSFKYYYKEQIIKDKLSNKQKFILKKEVSYDNMDKG